MNQTISAFRVDGFAAAPATRRKVFEFAKSINAPMLVVGIGADASSFADLDTLAQEFAINVAIESRTDPKAVMNALEGRSKRLGVAADLGGWMQAGVKPVDGLAVAKDKLLIVDVTDRD